MATVHVNRIGRNVLGKNEKWVKFMYKIISGYVEFEVRATYKTWLNKEKDFVGVYQQYIEPKLIKTEDYDKYIDMFYDDVKAIIKEDLDEDHVFYSHGYESYSKTYRNIIHCDYIKLKTPINTKDITEVTVEKLREISNIKQFVEIENYYKNKLSAKENINAK